MSIEREQRALRSTLVVTGLGYAAQALSLVAIPLFLKTVGADGYGLMVTVMAFMGYLGFADAGLSWGSMILIAQAEGRKDRIGIAHIVRHSVVLAVGSGLVAMLVVGVILTAAARGWRLPMFQGHPESDRLILLAGLQLALNLQFGIVYNLFQGLQENHWTGLYQGGNRLAGLVGAMGMAWATHDVALMLGIQVLFSVLAGVIATIHAWLRHPWAFARGSWGDRSQYEAQLRVGAKNLILQVGRTMGGSAPTMAISSVLGPGMVPYYTVPFSLLSFFLTPINSWSASMQSAYGEAREAGALDWVRNAFRASLIRALLFGGLGAVFVLTCGDSFIRLWTHDRLSLSPALAVSVVLIGLNGMLMTSGQYLLTGLNRHKRAAFAEVGTGILALVSVPLLVGWWGLGGVGAGVIAATLLMSGRVLWGELTMQLGTGFLPGWTSLGWICLTMGCAWLPAFLILRGPTLGVQWLNLLLAGGGIATVFLIGAWRLGYVESSDLLRPFAKLRRRRLTEGRAGSSI